MLGGVRDSQFDIVPIHPEGAKVRCRMRVLYAAPLESLLSDESEKMAADYARQYPGDVRSQEFDTSSVS